MNDREVGMDGNDGAQQTFEQASGCERMCDRSNVTFNWSRLIHAAASIRSNRLDRNVTVASLSCGRKLNTPREYR